MHYYLVTPGGILLRRIVTNLCFNVERFTLEAGNKSRKILNQFLPSF